MGDFLAKNITPFDLALTLDCGQAFRWAKTDDDAFHGVAFGKYLKVKQVGSDVIFYNTTSEDFESIWSVYFDFNRDYNEILNRCAKSEIIAPMLNTTSGIRILKQEPWEALCSFIISQNNNIPRIKGIIQRLCENFGEPLENGLYTFPAPERLKDLSVEDLAPLRSGFRAKYILDAAKKCSSEIDLNEVCEMPIDDARNTLMTIKGVGKKVADCTLLYGMGFIESFPIDVWIKRALETLFANGFPSEFNDCAGIVQQYIFHFIRTQNEKN